VLEKRGERLTGFGDGWVVEVHDILSSAISSCVDVSKSNRGTWLF
jgi:hypothetical protein